MSDSFVYSTLGQDVAYTIYKKSGNEIPQVAGKVLVKGGAHVADNKSLVTPFGVVTRVSAADLELLQQNRSFQEHVKGGFIKVEKRNIDVNKVAADMTEKDKSAQATDADFAEEKAPLISEEKKPQTLVNPKAGKKSGKK